MLPRKRCKPRKLCSSREWAVEPLEPRQLLTTVVVNTILDTTGTSQTSLRDAIAIANSSTTPTTITFDPTVFATPQTIQLNSELTLTNDFRSTTITGPAATLTIRGLGNTINTVFTIGSSTATSVVATFNNLTVTNGGGEGAFFCNGNVAFNNDVITGNAGNGIQNGDSISTFGSITLSNVVVSNNHYLGIVNCANSTVIANNVTVIGNGETGLENTGPFGSTPAGWTVGVATVTNSLIANNVEGFVNSGSATLTNVTFSGNSQYAINTSGNLKLTNDTIAGNKGGITNEGTVTIGNCIVAGNATYGSGIYDVSGPFTSEGYNFIGEVDSHTSGWISTDFTGTDTAPLNADLGALASNGGPTETLLPLTGSPVIDHGSNLLVPETLMTDQRGLPRVSNGTVDIGAVEVQVVTNVAPAVTLNPVSQISYGGTVTFSASATGTPVPTVQWQVSANGGSSYTNIAGATSTTYSFTVSVSNNGDLYRAVFSNSVGSATSGDATLTIQIPPAITQDISSHSAVAGSIATFSASASGTPAPTVQWYVLTPGALMYVAIPGATSPTYSFTATTTDNGNFYYAEFSNGVGSSAYTTAAKLTVTAPVGPTITMQPVNTTAPANSEAEFLAAASGNPTPTIQWQQSANGSTFSNIAGATSGQLLFAATSAMNGYEYRAVFTNGSGTATTTPAKLTVTTPTAQTPYFGTAVGTYINSVKVTILDNGGGAIHYTLNGSTPTATSPVYTAPLVITATTTIKAIDVKAGYYNSAAATATYTIAPAAPVIAPAAGNYINSVTVTLTETTAGATIHYTTDGSTPTSSSPVYTKPFTLTASHSVKAIAVKSGMAASSVSTSNYVVVPTSSIVSLSSGKAVANLSGTQGSQKFFKIVAPSGKKSLSITTTDADPSTQAMLYVLESALPTTTSYSAAVTIPNSHEILDLANTAAGTYYILLYGGFNYSGLTLTATYA